MLTPDSDGCLKWRLDADISNSKLHEALADLKARNAVIVPIATPARTWAAGDLVLAEGARGLFWWAKVTACHMDGTYNVFVYDDSPSGGQQWEHLAPMLSSYLHSRTVQSSRLSRVHQPGRWKYRHNQRVFWPCLHEKTGTNLRHTWLATFCCWS